MPPNQTGARIGSSANTWNRDSYYTLIGSGKEMSNEIVQIVETEREKSESLERESRNFPLQAVNLYSLRQFRESD